MNVKTQRYPNLLRITLNRQPKNTVLLDFYRIFTFFLYPPRPRLTVIFFWLIAHVTFVFTESKLNVIKTRGSLIILFHFTPQTFQEGRTGRLL